MRKTSRKKPRVVARETIFDEHVVIHIKVPLSSKKTSIRFGRKNLPCLTFAKFVKDRHKVVVYVHAPKAGLTGKELRASLSFWKETVSDGRVYLDIHLNETTEPVTHSLKVLADKRLLPQYRVSGGLVFKLFEPLVGWIVLVPVG